MNTTTTAEGGKNFSSKDGDDFEHLPARSRTPVYIPHGMELALPSPANHKRTGNFGSPSNEFWNPSHDRYCLTSGTEVNITNNTTVLVVDVPVKPIEKLKRAVKKMQRVSAGFFHSIFREINHHALFSDHNRLCKSADYSVM